MAEGVAAAGGVIVGDAVFDDPKAEPPADPVKAPLGWTWDRGVHKWRPKKPRGRNRSAASTPAETPVISHDEPGTDDRAGRDPDPAWMRGDDDKAAAGGKLKFADVPGQVKDDIAGLAGLIGMPVLAFLRTVDPYCGQALMDSYEPAVDAALPLICRSRKIISYFADDDRSDWLLWGKLAIALAPVARAVAEHHILRTVQLARDEETGQVQVLRRAPREEAGHGDHLTPPVMPEFTYAA